MKKNENGDITCECGRPINEHESYFVTTLMNRVYCKHCRPTVLSFDDELGRRNLRSYFEFEHLENHKNYKSDSRVKIACLIYKDSKSIKHELIKLGYEHFENERLVSNHGYGDFIVCYNGTFSSYDESFIKKETLIKSFNAIDCGVDEKMFLSIASTQITQ